MSDFREIESGKHILYDPVFGVQERQNILNRWSFHCADKYTAYKQQAYTFLFSTAYKQKWGLNYVTRLSFSSVLKVIVSTQKNKNDNISVRDILTLHI